MKQVQLLKVLLLSGIAFSCSQGKFKSDVGNRDATGSIAPNNQGSKSFDQSPLDVSKLPENSSTLADGGPTAGNSALAERPLDLNCEISSEQTLNINASAAADIKVANNSRVVMNVKGRFPN